MNLKLWLIWLLAILLLSVGFLEVKAGTGAIFKGDNVYLLKNNLRFKTGNTRIMTGDSDNPTIVPKSADVGSMYLVSGTSTWYTKTDDGSSTNWDLFITTDVGSGTDRRVPVYNGTDTGKIVESLLSIDLSGVMTLLGYASSSALFLDENKDLTATQLADGQLLIGSTLGNPSGGLISGTVNQVTVTNGSNSIQLSLPQDIDPTASPTFSGVSLTSLSDGSVLFVSGTSGVISEENGNFNWDHTLDILDINGSAQVDNIQLNDTTISTLGANLDLLLSPNGTGLVSSTASIGLTSQTEMRFYELPFLGTDYVGFSAPDSVSSTTIWKLPSSDGGASYTLATDGAGNLAWKPEPPIVIPPTVVTTLVASEVWWGSTIGTASSSPNFTWDDENDVLNIQGFLRLTEDGGPNYNEFMTSNDQSVNVTYFLPTSDGTASQTLSTDGNGQMFWETTTSSATLLSPTYSIWVTGTTGEASASPYLIPPTDGTASQTLTTGGNGQMFWETQVAVVDTDTVSNTVEFIVNQANAFTFGEAIYHNGTIWTSAQANSNATLAEYVVVSGTVNTFEAVKFGRYNKPAHGLEVGEHYFLSATVLGGSSTIEGPNYSAPLFYVEDSDYIHIGVYRPSVTPAVGSASGSLIYEFLVGDAADVAQGSANFASVQECIDFATDGNRCMLLPRIFTENIIIDKTIEIVGFGSSSVISGTVDWTTGSNGSTFMRAKIHGNASINTGVKNVIVTDSFIDSDSTFFVDSPTQNSVNIWQEE